MGGGGRGGGGWRAQGGSRPLLLRKALGRRHVGGSARLELGEQSAVLLASAQHALDGGGALGRLGGLAWFGGLGEARAVGWLEQVGWVEPLGRLGWEGGWLGLLPGQGG